MDILIYYVSRIPAIIIAVTIHDYIKALTCSKFGDNKFSSRLTLNPFAHIEPVGAALMLITGYGWGRPIQFSTANCIDRKKAVIITNMLPSLFNLFLGISFGLILKLFLFNILEAYRIVFDVNIYWFIEITLANIAIININMFFFNLIPIYPLDSSRILNLYLAPDLIMKIMKNEHILQFILLALMFIRVVETVLLPFTVILTRFSPYLY